MPNIGHSTLSGSDLHECKGVSSAASGYVQVADGAGSATWKKRLTKYSVTLTPALVAANTTAEQTFTVTGVGATDTCVGVSKPTAQAGLGIVGWRVTAADTIGITFSNNTAAGITPTASQTYTFIVWSD